jgi:hypothetical protein
MVESGGIRTEKFWITIRNDIFRIREIINHYIQKGEVDAYPAYVDEPLSKRIRRRTKAKREQKEAETSNTESLSALILSNQQTRNNRLDDIISKYETAFAKTTTKNQSPGPKTSRKRKAN